MKKIPERFWHPYYVLNVIVCLSYVALRLQRLSPNELGVPDPFGVTREQHIYFSAGVLILVRLLSAPTVDAYLATCFMFARVAVLLSLWFMDRSFFFVFLVLWALVFIVYPQPRYRHSGSILVLNNVTFDRHVLKNDSKTVNVVWVHATWSSRCTQLAPILGNLVTKYCHPRIRFCKIDVSRWPNIASMLNVSLSPACDQLPTVICFKQGVETGRIPSVSDVESNSSKWRRGFTAAHIIRALELEERLKEAEAWEADAKRQYRTQGISRSKED